MKKRKRIDLAVAAVLLIIILISLPFMKTVLIYDGVTSEYVYAIMGEPSGDLGSGVEILYWNLPFGFRFVTSIMLDGTDHVATECRLHNGYILIPPVCFVAVPLLLLGAYLIIRKRYL